nr:hypothetical protein [Castellaniella defragrans]
MDIDPVSAAAITAVPPGSEEQDHVMVARSIMDAETDRDRREKGMLPHPETQFAEIVPGLKFEFVVRLRELSVGEQPAFRPAFRIDLEGGFPARAGSA